MHGGLVDAGTHFLVFYILTSSLSLSSHSSFSFLVRRRQVKKKREGGRERKKEKKKKNKRSCSLLTVTMPYSHRPLENAFLVELLYLSTLLKGGACWKARRERFGILNPLCRCHYCDNMILRLLSLFRDNPTTIKVMPFLGMLLH